MTICLLEGNVEIIYSGLKIITEGAELPLPCLHLHCSFHLILIPQQISLMMSLRPANQKKGIASDVISVTFRKWNVCHGVGSWTCHPWYLFFPGKDLCPSVLWDRLLLVFFPPPEVPGWQQLGWLGTGFHQGALEESKSEKRPFSEQFLRSPLKRTKEQMWRAVGPRLRGKQSRCRFLVSNVLKFTSSPPVHPLAFPMLGFRFESVPWVKCIPTEFGHHNNWHMANDLYLKHGLKLAVSRAALTQRPGLSTNPGTPDCGFKMRNVWYRLLLQLMGCGESGSLENL